MESGEKRQLTFPLSAWRGDGSPAFSPDGKTVAFVRHVLRSKADLYLTSVSGGEPRRLTSGHSYIPGLAWKPDGQEIVFSSSREGELKLWQVSVSGGAPQRLPLGPGFDEFPAISNDGRKLAFGRRQRHKNIWRAQLERGQETRPVSRLMASTRSDSLPAFSSDGKHIAFFSDRSGQLQLWMANRDGSKPSQLTFARGDVTSPPSWSPDGERIAFGASPGNNFDIYVIGRQGGKPQRLTSHPAHDCMASWSRDGRWVYFASDRSGSYQVWRIAVAGGGAVQVTKKGGYRTVESPQGDVLYYSKGRYVQDPWKVPPAGGEEVRVLQGLQSAWTVVGTGLYFYETRKSAGSKNRWLIQCYDLVTGLQDTLRELSTKPHFLASPAVSPDGKTILFVHQDEERTGDLLLVENFQ